MLHRISLPRNAMLNVTFATAQPFRSYQSFLRSQPASGEPTPATTPRHILTRSNTRSGGSTRPGTSGSRYPPSSYSNNNNGTRRSRTYSIASTCADPSSELDHEQLNRALTILADSQSRKACSYHSSCHSIAGLSIAMSVSSYKAHTPPRPATLDSRIVPFFEQFYATSDAKGDSHDQDYANSVTKDGTLIMGSKKATGFDEVLELRKGLWSGPVAKRKHHVSHIYPFTPMDCMLHGTVDYVLKNGKELSVDWAARAIFVEDVPDDGHDGKVQMRFYQVYVDSGPVAAAANSS